MKTTTLSLQDCGYTGPSQFETRPVLPPFRTTYPLPAHSSTHPKSSSPAPKLSLTVAYEERNHLFDSSAVEQWQTMRKTHCTPLLASETAKVTASSIQIDNIQSKANVQVELQDRISLEEFVVDQTMDSTDEASLRLLCKIHLGSIFRSRRRSFMRILDAIRKNNGDIVDANIDLS